MQNHPVSNPFHVLNSVPMAEEDGHTSKSFWAPLAVEYGGYVPLQAGSIDGTDTVPHDRGIVRAMNSRCETAVSREFYPSALMATVLLYIQINPTSR